jgi:uncharacterized protein (DUF433 family)
VPVADPRVLGDDRPPPLADPGEPLLVAGVLLGIGALAGCGADAVHWSRRCRTSEPMIVSDPKIMMGKPLIAGTRVTVELILEKLGCGESIEELIESHPRLTRDAILAALRFAAETLRADTVYPVGTRTA